MRQRNKSHGLRARAWWVIRKNKCVTLKELLLSLNDGEQKDPASNLGQYLRKLSLCGVLARKRVADGILTSNGVYEYRLVKDLGSQAPVMKKTGVYDPNSKALITVKDGN